MEPLNNRLEQIQRYMDHQKLDAVIITSPRHVYYLTGFNSDPHERFLGLVIPHGDEPVLITPELDRQAASQASSVQKIVTHTDTQNPYEVLKSTLPSSLRQVGIEKGHLTVNRYEQLKAAIGAEVFLDMEALLQEMRSVKTSEEVQRIKHAIRLVEDVLREGLKKVQVGVTEIEIVAELEYQMKKLGAQGPSFETMVLAGEKSALPHGKPDHRPIKEGEFLLFDLGVYADGYISDITRTFAVGRVTQRMASMYEAVLAANRAGIDATKPGVTFASIDQQAREAIAERGYGEYFIHRLGHGMGLETHEYPSVHGENQDIAKTGNVFTIEPGVYIPEVGGVRIEDDVLVTDNGCEVLTTFPKELKIIG